MELNCMSNFGDYCNTNNLLLQSIKRRLIHILFLTVMFKFCARYGYGLMDAGALVVEAQSWSSSGFHLPPQKLFRLAVVSDGSKKNVSPTVSSQEKIFTFQIDTTDADGEKIERLEHVTCIVSAKMNGRRGNVQFFIQSPAGKFIPFLSDKKRLF